MLIEFRLYLPAYESTLGWFRLELQDNGPRYRLVHIVGNDERVVFGGCDFRPGAGSYYWDRRAIGDLMFFLTLKPGDTDEEYFEKYSTEQLEYARVHAERLGIEACELLGED